ncbi:MAG: chromosome segregation protein SMC [Gemmatimonadota bacterium]
MKLKSLTLHGFKSFADRTRIDFHEGITAIVGPNGCGKSNISDALRWVLGEQRPTAIRGARMEEAIFEGTAERKPIHRAEVAMALSNEDRRLALPHDEVLIGRTVHRGGENVYSLNGRTCRLRDVQDLCRDTGLGANAYSIIEGRMIDAILSDRAEERRALFEEAAGIGRYKDRRRTALRRLDQAEVDLKRLEDLLGEVGSKVRSLGRQRGRARRYAELRERRLVLEIAVADARLRDIEARLAEAEAELARRAEGRPERETDLSRRETEAEALRLRIAETERERSDAASRLEADRRRLEELERARLVREERVAAAAARLEQVREERAGLAGRRAAIQEELAGLAREQEEVAARLAETNARLTERRDAVAELRELRAESKREEERALGELAEIVRRLGAREAEDQARRELSAERVEELERRRAEASETEASEAELESVLGAAEEEAEAARGVLADARELLASRHEEWTRLREAVHEARQALSDMEGELSRCTARAGGLSGILASGRARPAIVSALLEERGAVAGVLGTLADSLRVPKAHAPAVEACLGVFLHAVLARDWNAVREVRDWLRGRKETGSLLLLPLDPGPRIRGEAGAAGAGSLLGRVEVDGPGREWLDALLGGVRHRDDATFEPASGAWVASDGSGQDRWGVVRVGRPEGGGGVLTLRSELADLERRAADLEAERAGAQAGLEEAERAVTEAREAHEAAEVEVAAAERGVREAELRVEIVAERLERARARRGELASRIRTLEAALRDADSPMEGDDGRAEALEREREAAEGRLAEHRESALEATTQWETENAALHELQIQIARTESEREALEEKRRRAAVSEREAAEREARLDRELAELEAAIRDAGTQAEEGERELGRLLEGREGAEAALRAVEERLEARKRELSEREEALRAARRIEKEETEGRHVLELEITELRGRRATIRERLEGEWDESLQALRERVEPPGEGGPAEWAEELEGVRTSLLRMGPVNLLAAEEYDEEKERLDFLEAQKSDLVAARDDLHDSIRRINEAASEAFRDVFGQVRDNFQRIFETLFEGGECDLRLEDPEDELDSPIEIAASPRGKRIQRIHLLSGGERALTALALLFAIYLAKPSPFCVLDEVDAPLDESNVGRFTAMLERFKPETQFIVITHNARTIEAADWIYGVTMQEPGVTSLVSMEIRDLPSGQVA